MTIFAAFDATPSPLAGLSPTWVALFNASTGLPIAQPTISNLGSGLYLIGSGLSGTSAGIIDLGATAVPRYLHLYAAAPGTAAAFDGASVPLAGLSPTWDSFVDDAGAPASAPTITELGSGLYRIDYSGPNSRTGVIDFGATAFPRYSTWNFDPFNADPPVISNMTPAPGSIVSSDVIEFDVDDLDPGLLTVIIYCKYADQPETLLVHDGTDFKSPWDTSDNVRTAIANGFHYALKPGGGWTGSFDLDVVAIDGEGNLV